MINKIIIINTIKQMMHFTTFYIYLINNNRFLQLATQTLVLYACKLILFPEIVSAEELTNLDKPQPPGEDHSIRNFLIVWGIIAILGYITYELSGGDEAEAAREIIREISKEVSRLGGSDTE